MLAGTYGAASVTIDAGTIESVDMQDKSCQVQPLDQTKGVIRVELMAETGDGILIEPAKDSTIVFIYSRLIAPVAVQFSKIDSVFILAKGSRFKIYDQGIELMGAKYGGLTKTLELKEQLNKTTTLLQHLISIITGPPINEPGSGSPSALQAALSAAIASDALGDFSDIENPKVKHGDGTKP
jgi:hypothetical protein